MKLQVNENKLELISKYATDVIHMDHTGCSKNILIEELDYLYVVIEECTNFPRVHLLSSFSENEALETIDTYLREEEDQEESHLIASFKITEVL